MADAKRVTVRGKFEHPDGAPAAGWVTFTARAATASTTAKANVVSAPVRADLDDQGALSVDLVATDDPDVQPNGWTYEVRETFAHGGARRPYDIDVPLAALADGLDL